MISLNVSVISGISSLIIAKALKQITFAVDSIIILFERI